MSRRLLGSHSDPVGLGMAQGGEEGGGRVQSAEAIVGIGGSAGALSALQELFENLPADCPLGFVVVSHGDPTSPSLLPEILGRCTRMPVRPAEEGSVVAPASVHVAPAGRHVSIRDGVLHLDEPVERGHPPLPIDVFLRSLAHDRGARSAGIVLSGTGTDGTLGLGAIREASGLALAQDPETAEFGAMPASARAQGAVDLVLPVADMPQRLLEFAGGAPAGRRPPEADEAPDDGLERIVSLVASHTGRDFSAYKRGTLQRRVERRMGLHQVTDLAGYARYLKEDPSEIEALWRDWLIGVSSFFRDPSAFAGLADALDALVATKSEGSPLRVWVPGCATGEEVYSIAMLVFEALDRTHRRPDLQMFATDLDAAAVDVARSGRYPEGIASDVGEERIRRFFDTDDDHYRIKNEVRDCIVFAPQDLLRDPPFTTMDLISCRNLLIYLEAAAQKRVLALLHYSLAPDGLLFLGASESITGLEELFEAVDKRWKIFRRQEAGARAGFPLEWVGGAPASPRAREDRDEARRPRPVDYADLLRRQLADRYAPPAVIVDEGGQIEHIHGRTGAFLEPAPGRATLNVLDMAREGLRTPLSSALREVAADGAETVERDVRVRSNGERVRTRLVVRRISDHRLARLMILVSFEPAEDGPEQAERTSEEPPAQKPPRRVEELEAELGATREDLQGTVEDLQAANEELASANEEVQSVNEELQSMNEELLTSKEETQSLNEELQTVNAQLNAKVEGLEAAQDDLMNLVNATQVTFIYLDEHLCVRRYTPEARKLFRLIETDVGRPLADLVTSLDYPALGTDAEAVLETLVPSEKEVQAHDGSWWTAKIRPYRTSRNAIGGLVLTFVDVTRIKEAARRAEKASRAFESIVDTVREPLLVLDGGLRVVRANTSFYRTFRVEAGQTEGMPVYALGEGQWDIPDLRDLLDRILTANESFEDYAVEHAFPAIGRRRMLLNARRIERSDADDRILLAIEDVTERPGSEPHSEPGSEP